MSDLGKSDWEDFQKHPCYVQLAQEWKERERVVLAELRKGNSNMGSDDTLRGRLSELEFISGTVQAFIDDFELLENSQQKTNKEEKET